MVWRKGWGTIWFGRGRRMRHFGFCPYCGQICAWGETRRYPTREEEIQDLEVIAKDLERELKYINDRIKELRK